jgi:hypothetical protein
LTVPPAIQNNVLLFTPVKQINPMHHSKTDKIEFIIISKFIFPTHDLKLTSLCLKGTSETLAPVEGERLMQMEKNNDFVRPVKKSVL